MTRLTMATELALARVSLDLRWWCFVSCALKHSLICHQVQGVIVFT